MRTKGGVCGCYGREERFSRVLVSLVGAAVVTEETAKAAMRYEAKVVAVEKSMVTMEIEKCGEYGNAMRLMLNEEIESKC